MIGKLVATSIIQGGPGLPVLLPAAYRYICYNDYRGEEIGIVPDPFVRKLLDDVSSHSVARVLPT